MASCWRRMRSTGACSIPFLRTAALQRITIISIGSRCPLERSILHGVVVNFATESWRRTGLASAFDQSGLEWSMLNDPAANRY